MCVILRSWGYLGRHLGHIGAPPGPKSHFQVDLGRHFGGHGAPFGGQWCQKGCQNRTEMSSQRVPGHSLRQTLQSHASRWYKEAENTSLLGWPMWLKCVCAQDRFLMPLGALLEHVWLPFVHLWEHKWAKGCTSEALFATHAHHYGFTSVLHGKQGPK